jgi:hypothetical protein
VGFVVPAFAVGDANPWTAGCRADIDCGCGGLVVAPRDGFEDDPALVGREAGLVEIVSSVGDETSRHSVPARRIDHRQHSDL